VADAARIIAIDIHDATLQKARPFGATDVINSATVNAVEAVRDLPPGGTDGGFDFVGLSEVMAQPLKTLTVGGTLYLIGVSSPDSQLRVNLVDAVLQQPRLSEPTPARLTSSTTSRCTPGFISTDDSSWMPWCQPRSAWTRLSPVTSSSPTLM